MLLLCLLIVLPATAHAAAREIVSPRGLRVWLVEDHGTPVVTLGFRFAGGSAEDVTGKEGTAHFAAEMFFEGGGKLGTEEYLGRWSALGAEFNIEARLESLRGTIRVLTPDRDKAAELLSLAVNAPRYDAGSLDQVRDQIGAELDRNAADPESAAYLAYDLLGYAGHARARPVGGTRASIGRIAAADIARYRDEVMARDGLTLAAVGDISDAELGPLVDRIFAGVPAHGKASALTPPPPTKANRRDLALASGEATVVFGLALPGLSEQERLSAELLNYTLGGSAFTSRLYHSVRERRGLAYSIGSTLDSYSFMSELSGSFSSAPATVEEAIGLLRAELAKLSSEPPTDAEVDEAKAALAGDYLRGLIRQADMANELTLRMAEGAKPDCIESHAARLAAISPDDVRALARRIAWLDSLVVVTVGAPPNTGEAGGERARLPAPPANEP